MKVVVDEKKEFEFRRQSFLKYREDGYPNLDFGLRGILDLMNEIDFVPCWSCAGHPDEEDKREGYLSFVTLDPKLAFNWFMLIKEKFPSVSFEYDSLMLSEFTDHDNEDYKFCWSATVRWDSANGTEIPLGVIERTLRHVLAGKIVSK